MKYETVIGLEVHAELATKSKAFCGCSTEFGNPENTQCCPICTGMPGTLPVLNKKVIDYCIKAGLATNCKITLNGKQDRKNYFYADSPKAYQISQYDKPLCYDGYVEVNIGDEVKKIGIERIHIEEDAGKLVHDTYVGTRIDLNRSGVPLIEIVTKPDIRSPEEACAFLETLRNILLYIGVSDCKMEEGSFRCDINLSIRPVGQKEYGTRTEMKNINSFSGALRAMEYERARQIEVLDAGGIIEQETRRWDDDKGENTVMRTKEDAQDYRYFPDPDLMPIVIDEDWIERIRKTLPELPHIKRERYKTQYNLPDYDAQFITNSKKLAEFFEECVDKGADPKTVSNWIMGDISKILNDKEITAEDIPFPASYLSQMLDMIESGKISNTIGKKILKFMFEENKTPDEIVKEHNLIQISDEGAILELVKDVISKNEKSVNDYKNGKKNALGFLVGQCMRASKGKANPQIINKLLLKILEE